jgi:hypothetical protein
MIIYFQYKLRITLTFPDPLAKFRVKIKYEKSRNPPENKDDIPTILKTLALNIKSILKHSKGTPLHFIMITDAGSKNQVIFDTRDGSHRDNFGESLETLSAVESQLWVSF